MSKIVIGITSGIAAYKILDLISLLKKEDHEITVLMSRSARKIVNPHDIKELTGKNVYIELFPPNFSKNKIISSRKIDHIEIAKNADIFVVAPATANSIAKMAHGIADNFLTTTLLATQSPILVCPSMNDVMWYHPATQKNLKTIESYGYEIMTPETGALACGTDGIGRLPKVKNISDKISNILNRSKILSGKRILVTGGGTIEPIDDARVITNRSSGKMGKALAEAAYRMGADVTYIHAQTSIKSHLPFKQVVFTTTQELSNHLNEQLDNCDIIFHSAAVSDFSVKKIDGKIPSDNNLTLQLEKTQKLINKIKKINPKITLVGFKAIARPSEALAKEGHPALDAGSRTYNTWILNQVQNDTKKIFTDAQADYIVINDISRPDIGFEADENEVYVISKNGEITKIQKAPKIKIAEKIIEIIQNFEL